MSIVHTLIQDIKNGTSHSVDFLLEESCEATLSTYGVHIRKIFAPILRRVYRTQTEYKIIVDSREPLPKSKTGCIFAVNHRQSDDIVIGANAANKSSYVVVGNPCLVLETMNALGLWSYGTILFHRDKASARKATYDKMKWVLSHGGNIVIFPEGYWNLDDDGKADEQHEADGHNSENWLLQDFNIGIFRLAQETGAAIIPTVLHYDEHKKKRCYTARGEAFYVRPYDDVFARKDALVEIMQTMVYNLMEKYSFYHRAELEREKPLKEQWIELKENLRSACDIPKIGYRLDLQDEKKIGKAKVVKPVVGREEAFEHLGKLVLRKENAFLVRK